MLELIVGAAQADDRVRAVILNGSRANPNAPRDLFQDFDIVYIVTDVAPFKDGGRWVTQRFGDVIIRQTPDDMGQPASDGRGAYAYLMLLADGNRIDLTLYPLARLADLPPDSLSVLLLDKDGLIQPFPPPSDSDYWPRPPSPKQFQDCCNEFWWVTTYVAKGLWRDEITYAKAMLDQAVREQLMTMLAWYVGTRTEFRRSPGKEGKYLRQFLEPEQWALLLKTYSNAGVESTWEALENMVSLFRFTALPVAQHFGFEYPAGDDARVSAHLEHVRRLPRDAKAIY